MSAQEHHAIELERADVVGKLSKPESRRIPGLRVQLLALSLFW